MKNISRRNFIPFSALGILGTTFLSFTKTETKNVSKILPPTLSKGDMVGVCAPAGCLSDQSEIISFTKVIEHNGFQVRFGANVTKQWGYFSATDEERAFEFMQMIRDKEIKAIFFVRGGWGCARILDLLDYEVIRLNPKVIMGFSDITSLLQAITLKTGSVTLHGPNGNASWNERTMEYFHNLTAFGKKYTFQNLNYDRKIRTIVPGLAEGELYGGNLSVLVSMLGTNYLPDWRGKILFLEDLKEEPYRIDRMLTHLRMAGVYDNVSGIILGVFRDCDAENPKRAFTMDQLFDQHFGSLNIPVFCNAQFGHVIDKFILPIGSKVKINSVDGSIEMLESFVS